MDTKLDKPRILAVALTLLGMLVFGGLLSLVVLSPRNFEARAQSFIIAEIEAALGRTTSVAGSIWTPEMSKALPAELAARQRDFLKGLGDFVIAAVAAMCRLDCAARAQLESAMQSIYDEHLASLKLGAEKLRDIVEGRYSAVLAELRRDIIIFLVCNLGVVTLAFLLALLRRGAADHLLPISVILSLSTLIGSYWYVFGQNWILTVVYADYAGWSYLVGLGVLFLLLVDVGLNRARMTSEVLNAMARMIGSGHSWSPC